jgi:hypothetical protein
MINLLIAFDDADKNRGEYFKYSHDDFLRNLNQLDKINCLALDSKKCLSTSIDKHISSFNGNSFIFVAYAHGSDESIYISDVSYIHTKNTYLFADTFFYACGCNSAKILGKNLKTQGCKVFIGYNGQLSSCLPETEPIFYYCENSFLNRFLTTNDTIQECLNHMYDTYMKMTISQNNEVSAFELGILEKNLDSFEIICDDKDFNLTQSYFWA